MHWTREMQQCRFDLPKLEWQNAISTTMAFDEIINQTLVRSGVLNNQMNEKQLANLLNKVRREVGRSSGGVQQHRDAPQSKQIIAALAFKATHPGPVWIHLLWFWGYLCLETTIHAAEMTDM